MESLDLVMLFSVVVAAWVGWAAHVYACVSQVNQNPVLLCGEQVVAHILRRTLCPIPVAVPIKLSRIFRLRGDRRIDSGRGRPPLHLN